MAAVLIAGSLAACGSSTKHSATSTATGTASAPATTTTSQPATKAVYQTRSLLVLRPMLQAINAALQSPRDPNVWQHLQHQATHAYVTIKRLTPPPAVSALHDQLVGQLSNVAATAGGLFHAFSSGDLASARPLGLRMVTEGQAITSLGNQFKARGYTQLGAILAGP